MKREEIADVVEAKHAARLERARQHIGSAPSVLSARDRFRDAVASLPGVANDPGTVESVLLLADQLVQRKEDLDKLAMLNTRRQRGSW
jgi:hypothetical protein